MNSWEMQRKTRLAQEYHARELAVTAATSDLVATLNLDGFFLSLNLAGFQLLGLALQDNVEQLRLQGFMDTESRKQLLTHDLPNAIRFGIWQSEVTLVDKALARIPCSQVLVAHRDGAGQVEYFSAILRDSRSLKLAEQERLRLLEQLHEAKKLETVGRLAGGIAHDFNNFITIIMGYAELALLQQGLDFELRNDLNIILDSARKASRLTAQLLDYSSKKMIEPQVLDLNQVLREAEQLVISLMGSRLNVRFDLADELWYVRFDRSQLEQIIFNLAVNARDAMTGTGDFRISTRNVALVAVPDNLNEPCGNDYVLLTVSDTGSGIPASILPRIFEPFYTTKEKGKGTGMGLSAVQGAVRQNRAEIFVKSIEGTGTTFTLYIPAVRHESPVADTTPASHDPALTAAKGTLLLVEDNTDVRQLVSRMLARVGYRVLQAADGLEGMACFLEHMDSIDLVISDVVMPGLDGYQLAQKMLREKAGQKILMVSGHNEEILAFRESDQPNVQMLNKPFTADRLVQEVASLLA